MESNNVKNTSVKKEIIEDATHQKTSTTAVATNIQPTNTTANTHLNGQSSSGSKALKQSTQQQQQPVKNTNSTQPFHTQQKEQQKSNQQILPQPIRQLAPPQTHLARPTTSYGLPKDASSDAKTVISTSSSAASSKADKNTTNDDRGVSVDGPNSYRAANQTPQSSRTQNPSMATGPMVSQTPYSAATTNTGHLNRMSTGRSNYYERPPLGGLPTNVSTGASSNTKHLMSTATMPNQETAMQQRLADGSAKREASMMTNPYQQAYSHPNKAGRNSM